MSLAQIQLGTPTAPLEWLAFWADGTRITFIERGAILGRGVILSRTRRRPDRGFSLVELVVSLAIVLILSAIAVPSLTRSYRTYQLNDAATRMASILKFTRFEAIRLNKLVSCQIVQNGSDWLVWADSNGNVVADPGEIQYLITGTATLMPAGAPPAPGPILSAIGANTLTTASGTNYSISFDHRGAVSPAAAFVMYIGSSTNPEFGYRAVILLPSGVTQVWTAPAGGVWQRVS